MVACDCIIYLILFEWFVYIKTNLPLKTTYRSRRFYICYYYIATRLLLKQSKCMK